MRGLAEWADGFLFVDGTGSPERALERGSSEGCITERRLESIVCVGIGIEDNVQIGNGTDC